MFSPLTFRLVFSSGYLRSRGMTLVELVVTMVIMGILAAIVVPRFSGETGFEARGFRDEAAAALRYAQKSAIAARRRVCVAFSSASQINFVIASAAGSSDCSVGNTLLGPGGDGLVVTAKTGVAFTALPSDFSFDGAGRPSFSTTRQLSVSGVPVLTIEAETGYVH